MRPLGCPAQASFPVRQSPLTTLRARAEENTTPVAADYVALLDAQASAPWNRVVTIISQDLYAFDVEVTWTAGQGRGGTFTLTAQGGVVRFPLLATSIRIKVANWVAFDNHVACSIEDGDVFGNYKLRRVVRNSAVSPSGGFSSDIPAYATDVQVMCSSRANLSNIEVLLVDASSIPIAQMSADDGEIALTTAKTLRCDNNSADTLGITAVFTIGL